MGKIFSRFGDGSPVYLSESELMQDLEEGTEDAADRGYNTFSIFFFHPIVSSA
jgi:hypothetical protein